MGVGVRKRRKELLFISIMLKTKFHIYGAGECIVATLLPLPKQRKIVIYLSISSISISVSVLGLCDKVLVVGGWRGGLCEKNPTAAPCLIRTAFSRLQKGPAANK